MKLVSFFKCKLLVPTPAEFIYLYVDVLEQKIVESLTADAKHLLISEALAFSYTVLGEYKPRLAALISLHNTLVNEWAWHNVWSRFE